MARPERLGDALSRALRGLNLTKRMHEGRAMALWPAVVGDVIASRTHPLFVNHGVLTVAVASSSWANELNLLKPRLMASLNEKVGRGVIQDLRWRVGEWQAGRFQAPEEPKAQAKARQEAALSAGERESVLRLVKDIPDPDLASRIASTLLGQAVRRARQRQEGFISCKRCGVLHDTTVSEGLFVPPQQSMPARLCPVCRMELAQLFGP
jgi:hypothetical protein